MHTHTHTYTRMHTHTHKHKYAHRHPQHTPTTYTQVIECVLEDFDVVFSPGFAGYGASPSFKDTTIMLSHAVVLAGLVISPLLLLFFFTTQVHAQQHWPTLKVLERKIAAQAIISAQLRCSQGTFVETLSYCRYFTKYSYHNGRVLFIGVHKHHGKYCCCVYCELLSEQ